MVTEKTAKNRVANNFISIVVFYTDIQNDLCIDTECLIIRQAFPQIYTRVPVVTGIIYIPVILILHGKLLELKNTFLMLIQYDYLRSVLAFLDRFGGYKMSSRTIRQEEEIGVMEIKIM